MKTTKNILFKFVFVFVLLFILTVPFPYHILPSIEHLVTPLFEHLLKWVATNLFGLKQPYTFNIISDSTGLYIHTFNLLIIAVLVAIMWHFLDRNKTNPNFLKSIFHTSVAYYLALQLLIYGFDKVFKRQFYLPEPNTLYTPLGNLYPDILYWSTVGSSYTYSVFTGLLEVIPALLLLAERTRLIGAICAMAVLVHVVLLNFSFDISVKVYSLFLLFFALILILPSAGRLYHFFILQKPTNKLSIQIKHQPIINLIVKFCIIGLILTESLYTYLDTGNFNDDKEDRPFLHGAYQTTLLIKNNDTIPLLITNKDIIKRFFIHRKGYLIIQNMNDEMKDYRLKYDLKNHSLILTDYDQSKIILKYADNAKDSLLILTGKFKNDSFKIYGKKLNIEQLPLLQNNFHWTIDDY